MDPRRQQVDLVTGKTFTTSQSMGSGSQTGNTFATGPSVGYSQWQMIPYTQPPMHMDYGSNVNYNSYNIDQAKVSKTKSTSSWNMDDPELKRRRRVASYKAYTVEGRVKYSVRKSMRWFKNKYLEVRYGWW